MDQMVKRVLMTGFDPFGGESVNPALEATLQLNGRVIDVYGTIIISERVPTVFHDAIRVLETAIDQHSPDIIICVGQAGGRSHMTPERVAVNVDDADLKDNAGQQPSDQPIVPDGPDAYFSRLPIKRIVDALRSEGIPASVSNSAGTFVCNHIFYGLMHRLHAAYPHVLGGFIHIPYLPEQTLSRQAPSMTLKTIVRGLEIAAVVTAEAARGENGHLIKA